MNLIRRISAEGGGRAVYVILTYDIHSKRVGKGLKVCRKYLRHVQRSVFEGAITEKQLLRLQKELYDFTEDL